ncbi:hypothetical protein ACN47E_006135 [Coniothyrium glycines]
MQMWSGCVSITLVTQLPLQKRDLRNRLSHAPFVSWLTDRPSPCTSVHTKRGVSCFLVSGDCTAQIQTPLRFAYVKLKPRTCACIVEQESKDVTEDCQDVKDALLKIGIATTPLKGIFHGLRMLMISH